jgi:hypothetical protein
MRADVTQLHTPNKQSISFRISHLDSSWQTSIGTCKVERRGNQRKRKRKPLTSKKTYIDANRVEKPQPAHMKSKPRGFHVQTPVTKIGHTHRTGGERREEEDEEREREKGREKREK